MALKGIKVIEFSGLAPAPFCGKILKDMGARVIRIDKTGANPDFPQDRLSHGKESIAINLKDKKGIEVIKKLAHNADVLIEPFRKGVMERLGLGPNVMLQINPKIVYARLTGYGQSGELSLKAGHDINYISYSGVLSTLGRENQKPHAPINLLADFAGGGLMCALAIMSSLYEQAIQKGPKKGNVIDCSMVEGSAYLSSWLWSSRSIPGLWEGTAKGTNLLDGGLPQYDTYETKDNKFMSVGSLEPAFYRDLLKGLSLNKEDDVTTEVLEKIFKTKTQQEWVETFKELDACVSPVLTLDEAPQHPHNIERNSFVKIDGTNYLPCMNWLNMDKLSRSFEMPLVGQHTSQILKEHGYSKEEIKEFINGRIVYENSDNHTKSTSKL